MNVAKLLLFFLALSSASFQAYAQKNMELVGRLEYPLDSGISKSVFLNDIWGYVDSSGNEYALVGTLSGLSIVDLQDPANPQEIHFVRGDTSLWRDIKTYQNFAYVVNERGGGLTIVDLGGLPESIQSKDTLFTDSVFTERLVVTEDTLENGSIVNDTTQVIDTTFRNIRRAHNLYQDQGTLYMVGPNQYNGGMVMLDLIQDPWNPSIKGLYSQRYVHDVYVRDNLAYTAEINNRQMGIVDLSNPEEPQVLGTRTYPGAFTHNTWLNDSSTVCFTTDERSAAFVIAWDIRDPQNIEELDRIRSSLSEGRATPHNVHVFNDFLITSYYHDGVQLVDAQRPHNLIEIGYYDTHPDSLGGFNGVWGAYPFLPSGLVLASDRSEGLFVFQPNYVRGSYLEGLITDARTGQSLDRVEIFSKDIPRFYERSANDGSFAMGSVENGTIQVIFKKFGYVSDTLAVTLQNGELVEVRVALQPAARKTLVLNVVDENTLEGLKDVPLSLFVPEFGERFEARADALGFYSESLPEDTYELLVGNWGYRSQKILLNLTEELADTLIIPLEVGYYDDFGLDFGWGASGTPRRGLWERAFPSPTYLGSALLNPDRDAPNDLDSMAYVTDNSGINFQDADVDNVLTVLRSPIMDLSLYENPVVYYSYWLSAVQGNFSFIPSMDSLEVYLHNGQESVLVKKHGGPFSNGWLREFFMPSDYLALSDSMWVSYSIIDTNPADFIEAGIDHFEVREALPLRLYVRDKESSLPIDSTNLLFEPSGLQGRLAYKTDSMGGFSGLLPSNESKLFLGKWGYQTLEIELNIQDNPNDSILVELAPSYYDDFLFDLGWEVMGSPFQGHWQRAIPRATFFGEVLLNPAEDVPGDFGTYAFVTDNRGVDFFDAEVDSVPTTLISPIIDLSIFEDPLLQFSFWYASLQADFDNIPSDDSLKIYLYTPLDTLLIGSIGGPTTGNWEREEVALNSFLSESDSVRIGFFIQDSGEADLIEVGIDRFEIVESGTVSHSEKLFSPIEIYPNPVEDVLHLHIPSQNATNWKLFDAQGRLIDQGNLSPSEKIQRIIFPYPQGVYFLYLENGKFPLYWKKLIK